MRASCTRDFNRASAASFAHAAVAPLRGSPSPVLMAANPPSAMVVGTPLPEGTIESLAPGGGRGGAAVPPFRRPQARPRYALPSHTDSLSGVLGDTLERVVSEGSWQRGEAGKAEVLKIADVLFYYTFSSDRLSKGSSSVVHSSEASAASHTARVRCAAKMLPAQTSTLRLGAAVVDMLCRK